MTEDDVRRIVREEIAQHDQQVQRKRILKQYHDQVGWCRARGMKPPMKASWMK